MALSAGARLGPYEIVGRIGAGGMGEVWKARDTRLGREVAIKVLPEAFAEDADRLRRFEQEARAVGGLNHPNILTLHDIGTHKGAPYLVMELLEGGTLRERLAKGPLPVAEALVIAAQVAHGLAAAHGKGIVHRDLKPENLFLTHDGVKILDFGLAKQSSSLFRGFGSETPTEDFLHATAEGTVLGTVGYMSPEQVRGAGVDARSDLFSLGVVLWEMLTGQRPFHGATPADTLSAILTAKPQEEPGHPLPPGTKGIIEHLLRKDPAGRPAHAEDVVAALEGLARPHLWNRRWNMALAFGLLLALGAAGAGARVALNTQRATRARQELLPQALRLLGDAKESGDYRAVYALVAEAAKEIPEDPRLPSLLSATSGTASFTSEPSGAVVSLRLFDDPKAPWKRLGTTPSGPVRLPVSTYLARLEKPGYEPVTAVFPIEGRESAEMERQMLTVRRVLDPMGSLPLGMVRVCSQVDLPDFWIDATEVTNQAYRAFIVAGGYRNKAYWTELLASPDGRKGWPASVASFTDQTGRHGPSSWQAGDFPAGQERYPVSGVSWYEAVAFAEWSGKHLPSQRHWKAAQGPSATFSLLIRSSNFGGRGTVPVASLPSLSAFGAYDMTGNVREWCWNQTSTGRWVGGGAWDDYPYVAVEDGSASPLDRSPRNGFRCVKYLDQSAIPAQVLAPIEREQELRDFTVARPASEAVFRVYRELFDYDRTDLGARVEWRQAEARDWVQERVVLRAAYDQGQLPVYLFLPKAGKPPHQTVIYFPGSNAIYTRSSHDLDRTAGFEDNLAHFLKSGRAVVYPVYLGTFERGLETIPRSSGGESSHQAAERFIKRVKDLMRTLDYLETRPELDHGRVAYVGLSWGAWMGSIIPAVEPRLRASVLIVGGMMGRQVRPEIDQINYVGRVRIPTLMLNGRFDAIMPLQTGVKPMFDLLGTPPGQKALRLYDTDHFVPRNEMVKESLAWLDRHLGPVQ